ncbi:MAG TPA: bifunctional phosphoribosylaminoimidazolecarboxamide formyltransferase/IMP cyclohydrolase [Thermoflexales bacterium]|nr:bifunctional phosphoribosylaminoimidazolecarboxamide formyltransferase/IMP cyclohydrolase [Thermoflexales bacterium]HQW36195.1 bifunctional phosphoribosylaminoimidazolecarboxamide formyltransferase/IMP cyclohydrolase [Thermoflexales bacterium]HQZ21540.1 bifunctional phosphoribosylaminoimidazolecarboxamide formyltransferase/IMP cyclohydrolase [Thermoflexales bacterium]
MKALLSVSDKAGLVQLAQRLHDKKVELIATGGTARELRQAGLPITTVENLTGSPEILEGRVKTLHPRVHGGILAQDTAEDRADLGRIGAEMIDIVIANLYPFQQVVAQKFVTLHDAIENIDIGGVALLRAAAKNYARVAVVCDPDDYDIVARDIEQHGAVSLETREVLALKAFAHTAAYDTAIRDYLMGMNDENAPVLSLSLHKIQDLRYGENPHQEAALYSLNSKAKGPLNGRALHGKELSYNNLLDLDAAWRAALQFDQPAIVIVKHLSPCGIACADTLPRAFHAAYACDPTSAFGGVIASNWEIDVDTVKAMGDLFVECIIAPGFQDEAIEMLRKRKNLRLVEADPELTEKFEYRTITGGILRQSLDKGDPVEAHWKCMTKVQPTDEQLRALQFAWAACQHVKSNAIVFAKEHNGVMATVGIGGGQPNRVDSVRIAASRAGKQAKGAALASDAFFPFADGVKEAIKAGIVAIAQPGGSQRDAEAIAAANEAGIAMMFTGARHFRH